MNSNYVTFDERTSKKVIAMKEFFGSKKFLYLIYAFIGIETLLFIFNTLSQVINKSFKISSTFFNLAVTALIIFLIVRFFLDVHKKSKENDPYFSLLRSLSSFRKVVKIILIILTVLLGIAALVTLAGSSAIGTLDEQTYQQVLQQASAQGQVINVTLEEFKNLMTIVMAIVLVAFGIYLALTYTFCKCTSVAYQSILFDNEDKHVFAVIFMVMVGLLAGYNLIQAFLNLFGINTIVSTTGLDFNTVLPNQAALVINFFSSLVNCCLSGIIIYCFYVLRRILMTTSGSISIYDPSKEVYTVNQEDIFDNKDDNK